ncbi:acetoacetate decarboxylase family protein [Saccharothrix coeruleofusca]|uniref:Acetoacetate decarboxylase n=1 Tax=Saccharothrix coeruleofusca TaxID=33919 RepID=A0A918API4_9PSEU|nr:acetoacetate decarboxylase family protein [Saccharothrix coeruleofusca]GGP65188.1 acetoacetate decarboxylase [Saccharothrix coeruleofusca]
MDGYPPEPWNLRARACVSLWSVDRDRLPALPVGVRPLALRGRAVVATAFVDYLPGGVLTYRELLAAVAVRGGTRPGVSITHIWVDSAASRAGGRQLWGIPKEMAEFEVAGDFTASARVDGEVVASVRCAGLPSGVPAPAWASTWQELGGELVRTPLRVSGRVRPVRAAWRLSGPLAWVTGARPLVSVAVTDARLRFGPRAR